jgi:hypothetical protein
VGAGWIQIPINVRALPDARFGSGVNGVPMQKSALQEFEAKLVLLPTLKFNAFSL